MTSTWLDANQQFLLGQFARLSGLLAGDPDSTTPEVRPPPDLEPPPAICTLAASFGLTEFERDILLVAAGVQLDSSIAKLCSGDESGRRQPLTFGLLLERFPHAHWSAISPGGVLRYLDFVHLADPLSPATSTLSLDERILDHLVGIDHPDDVVSRHITGPIRRPPLVESHLELARHVVARWSIDEPTATLPIIQLVGSDLAAAGDIAAAACDAAGLALCTASARTLPRTGDDVDRFVRHWEREAIISDLALLIECDESDDRDDDLAASVERIAREIRGTVFLACRGRRRTAGDRPVYTLDVESPTEAEQLELWQRRLDLDDTGHRLAELVSHFDLGVRDIDAASTVAQVSDVLETDDDRSEPPIGGIGSRLWEACRGQSRTEMADLARRITRRTPWDELVVPDGTREALESIVLRVRHRSRVYQDWGFAASSDRMAGVSALFAGPSGTGKTMAAEVLATELHLDLYAIDLSALVSKYIGETEKNLRRVFEAAEHSGAILLFDEADALFGRRSEVNDSHDRHANIEVSYLLQRMERYRGVAILTSNMKDSLDPAFERRLNFIIEFPFPSKEMRRELWARVFPDATPTEDLDPARLAQLDVSGGQIRNIARSAAFLAAHDDTPVSMDHLRRSAILEYAKVERHVSPAELKGWP